MTNKIYDKACIYKIFCKDEKIKDFYIGSTINTINNRWAGHKTTSKKNNNKLYKFIKDNGGFKNFDFEIIQDYPTNNLYKLREVENEYILILKPSLNSNKPFIEPSEREQYLKDYRKNNKERRKKWLEDNKEILKKKNKERYEKNKERFKIKKKEWEEKNKEIIKKKKKKRN